MVYTYDTYEGSAPSLLISYTLELLYLQWDFSCIFLLGFYHLTGCSLPPLLEQLNSNWLFIPSAMWPREDMGLSEKPNTYKWFIFLSSYALFSSPYLPSSCLLWARLYVLLPGGKASVLHRSGPRSQLAPVRHGAATLQRYDDCDVPDLRLQTSLARSADAFQMSDVATFISPKMPMWCEVWITRGLAKKCM